MESKAGDPEKGREVEARDDEQFEKEATGACFVQQDMRASLAGMAASKDEVQDGESRRVAKIVQRLGVP